MDKILIVDDRPENLLLLEKILRQPGLEIISASSGHQALSLVLEHDFALVLMDVQMPEMDGFETAELLRGNDETGRLPIIFVTAINKEEKYIFKGYEAGAVDYLFKPLEPVILRSKVKIFLELYRQRKLLEEANEELKRANQKILQQQKAVIEEERLKMLLYAASATAHEFNQPLTVMLVNIELLKREKEPAKAALIIAGIKHAAERISQVVQKIQNIPNQQTEIEATWSSFSDIKRGLKILVVDESDADFQMLEKLLRAHEKCELARAVDIASALSLLEKNRYDLILSECLFAEGSGAGFLAALKRRDLEAPIAIITRQEDELLGPQLMQAGAYDFLPKAGISANALNALITRTLNKFRLEGEINKAQIRIAEMATRDEMTGLVNRRYFTGVLEREFERARRYDKEMILVLMGLDHLKEINDSYGHPAGDMALKEVGAILRQQKRDSDLAGRFGGAEFGIILPDTDREKGRVVCEKFRQLIAARTFEYVGNTFSLTVSLGYASFQAATSTADLLSRAGKALSAARKKGRNQVVEAL